MVILVDYSRDDAFSADGSQVGHVPDTLHLHIRRPLPPGLVRPVAVVMADERASTASRPNMHLTRRYTSDSSTPRWSQQATDPAAKPQLTVRNRVPSGTA